MISLDTSKWKEQLDDALVTVDNIRKAAVFNFRLLFPDYYDAIFPNLSVDLLETRIKEKTPKKDAKVLVLVVTGLLTGFDASIYYAILNNLITQYDADPDICVDIFNWTDVVTDRKLYTINRICADQPVGYKVLRSFFLSYYQDFFYSSVLFPDVRKTFSEQLKRIASQLKPNASIVIVGHSMGGYLTRQLITELNKFFDDMDHSLRPEFVSTFLVSNKVYSISYCTPEISFVNTAPNTVRNIVKENYTVSHPADILSLPQYNRDGSVQSHHLKSTYYTIPHAQPWFDPEFYAIVDQMVVKAKKEYVSTTIPTIPIWNIRRDEIGKLVPIKEFDLDPSWQETDYYQQYGDDIFH